MDLFKQLFQVGDIIASFNQRGEVLDRPALVIEVTNRRGWYTYKCLRQDPDDIRVNGQWCTYAQGSIVRFKVVGHNPAAQILYTTKES